MALFIESVVFPVVVLVTLLAGLAGLAVGCGLLLNHTATLRFIGRMNVWVSTREMFARLDRPITLEPPPGASGRRPVLGAAFLVAGVVGITLLVSRLDFAQPGFSVGNPAFHIGLETMKWALIVGSAFAVLVGLLMIFAPQKLARLEVSLNKWHSTEELAAAPDKVHMPLEPIVEAYPRASGCVLAVASLFVALAMTELLIARLH